MPLTLIVLAFANGERAVEGHRYSVEPEVEALAVLVRPGRTDGVPELVPVLLLDHLVDGVRRASLGFVAVRGLAAFGSHLSFSFGSKVRACRGLSGWLL